MGLSTKNLLALSENILATTEPVKKVHAPKSSVVADDGLKDVVVSDNFVNDILSFSEKLNEASESKEEIESQPIVEDKLILEKKLESLVGRLKDLLKEAKTVLSEMTSTGCIGVGPQKSMGVVKRSQYPPKATDSMKFNKKRSKK